MKDSELEKLNNNIDKNSKKEDAIKNFSDMFKSSFLCLCIFANLS